MIERNAGVPAERRIEFRVGTHLGDVVDEAGTWQRMPPLETRANLALSRENECSNQFAPNRLLLALPSSNLKQLMPELELIRCEREQILVDVDSSLEHVFYPDSGVVSAVAVYSDGRVIETATIGREGCTNEQAALGAKRSSVRLLVQIPGNAQRMPRTTFVRAMGTVHLIKCRRPSGRQAREVD
jgi:CRP-like cAMP-binding protein